MRSEADANRNVLFERWAAPPRLLKFREVHPLGRNEWYIGRESSLIRMKRNRCSVQRRPIPGGTAKKCAYLEEIFGDVYFCRDGGAYLSSSGAPCWVLVRQRLWRSARRTRILLLEMRRRRSWANRNSGRTARFATGRAGGSVPTSARRVRRAQPTIWWSLCAVLAGGWRRAFPRR